jgi:hypothetical protein
MKATGHILRQEIFETSDRTWFTGTAATPTCRIICLNRPTTSTTKILRQRIRRLHQQLISDKVAYTKTSRARKDTSRIPCGQNSWQNDARNRNEADQVHM